MKDSAVASQLRQRIRISKAAHGNPNQCVASSTHHSPCLTPATVPATHGTHHIPLSCTSTTELKNMNETSDIHAMHQPAGTITLTSTPRAVRVCTCGVRTASSCSSGTALNTHCMKYKYGASCSGVGVHRVVLEASWCCLEAVVECPHAEVQSAMPTAALRHMQRNT